MKAQHFESLSNLTTADEKPQEMLLLLATSRKLKIKFEKAFQNWRKDCKTLPGMMHLDFRYSIQMVGSEIDVNNLKTWIHRVLYL